MSITLKNSDDHTDCGFLVNGKYINSKPKIIDTLAEIYSMPKGNIMIWGKANEYKEGDVVYFKFKDLPNKSEYCDDELKSDDEKQEMPNVLNLKL